MDIAKFIVAYDDVLPETSLDVFRRVLDSRKFAQAGIAGDSREEQGLVDFNIRRTWIYDISHQNNKLLTDIHWCNRFIAIFKHHLADYLNRFDISWKGYHLENISVLKYEDAGFYKPHVDHGTTTPRTYSMIFLVNDDYEGGDLCFHLPKEEQKINIKTKKNKLIIWPSNFMYPHTVESVTKGTRYSVVSWAL